MPAESFKKILFDAHTADLASVTNINDDKFVCPICLELFDRDDLNDGKLSDGHVWPDYIRGKSKNNNAVLHRVLICKRCNGWAGSRGDNQMQLREQIKDAEKRGEIFDERQVQVITEPNTQPIYLRASSSFRRDEKTKVRLTFQVQKSSGKWLRNNPAEQSRFHTVSSEKSFSMIVFPHHKLQPGLPEVGWITSAYHFAFYTFGYRYILHDSLNSVREYIQSSFNVSGAELQSLEVFSLTETDDIFYPDPEIGLIIPVNGIDPVHLQIGFLDYVMRLPFYGDQDVFSMLIQSVPDSGNLIAAAINSSSSLYCPISCTKMDQHECKWDYILGKPLPQS